MSSGISRRKKWIALGALGVGAVAVLVAPLFRKVDAPPPPSGEPSAPPTRIAADKAWGTTTLARLRGQSDRQRAIASLAEIRAELAKLPADEAAALITAALDSGEDDEFPLEFQVGEGGFLSGHPSWRVALLDWLGQIDPEAAAAYAERILAEPTSADEWAVAMRNYAQGNRNTEGNAFLQAKASEMLANDSWRARPSVGYLEAFDVFVYTGATSATPQLARVVADLTTEGKASAHAAFLTLDRLTLAAPEAMFEALEEEPDLLGARGPMVANFYARADLRESGQRAALERYILESARTQEELSALAGVYPNANRMISNNLLTAKDTPTGAEIVSHDREALEVIRGWLSDPRFNDPTVRPHVETMFNRLASFVRQAQSGR